MGSTRGTNILLSQAKDDENVVSTLRGLIMNGELAPGQQVRQEELSEQIGVSRSPVREALRALESEGLVRHSRNQGYFVVKLTRSELVQVYLMRKLLETELLRTVRKPSSSELSRLRAVNNDLGKAADEASVGKMLVINRKFHFAIFGLSPHDLILRQVQGLWHLSEAYRASYLSLPETRERVLNEHTQMIEALTSGDIDHLLQISDMHRSTSEKTVILLIGR